MGSITVKASPDSHHPLRRVWILQNATDSDTKRRRLAAVTDRPPGTGGGAGALSPQPPLAPQGWHSVGKGAAGGAPRALQAAVRAIAVDPPDPLTHSLVQRLEGQRVLGDRHQQRLPVQHGPGRRARGPGLPLPEVDRERDALRAVRAGAADLVPVNHRRGTVSSGPHERQRCEPQRTVASTRVTGQHALARGREPTSQTVPEAGPKEGRYQPGARAQGSSFPSHSLRPSWDGTAASCPRPALQTETQGPATKLSVRHHGTQLLQKHSQCPVLL